MSISKASQKHVRVIFRVVFDSSHFILQVANLVHGKREVVWVTVANQAEQERIELPAHLIPGINLPGGSNLVRRFVVELREVSMRFASYDEAWNYATGVLGLAPDDEPCVDMDVQAEKPPLWTRIKKFLKIM